MEFKQGLERCFLFMYIFLFMIMNYVNICIAFAFCEIRNTDGVVTIIISYFLLGFICFCIAAENKRAARYAEGIEALRFGAAVEKM